MSEIREQMKVDLRNAMKARDTERVTTLRSVLAAIDNAEAVPVAAAPFTVEPEAGQRTEVPRKVLTGDDIRQIIEREVAERRHASQTYAQVAQQAEAERLQRAATLLISYLS